MFNEKTELENYTGQFGHIKISFQIGLLKSVELNAHYPFKRQTKFKLSDFEQARYEFIMENKQIIGSFERYDD